LKVELEELVLWSQRFMDKLIQIFVKLGVDQSIFYQFAVFVVIFFLLKVTFFNKLLFVLQTRESKTTKLEEEALGKFKQAEKLSENFDKEIQKTSEEAHKKMTELKAESLKEIHGAQKLEEDRIQKEFEIEKRTALDEVENKRQEILKTSDSLASGLVEKFIN
jgi:F0F1-type ATP synthase membrane subunit b/b'